MAGIALVGYTLGLVLAVTAVWVFARRHPQPVPQLSAAARSLLAAARRRAVGAVALCALVIVVLFVAGSSWHSLAGLPVALAPTLGGAAGLLLYSAMPPRAVTVASDAPRDASLIPRTPLSFIPTRATGLFVAAIVVQIGILVFTGVTSSADDFGRLRAIAFVAGDASSASSPYAGWFYGGPLLVATAVLLLSTFLALWRVSTTPALPQRTDRTADAGWRRASNRIILAISGSALLLQLGGIALQSGLAVGSAFFEGVPAGWQVIGHVLVAIGLASLVTSVVCLTLAALWALTLRDQAPRASADVVGIDAMAKISR